ncbi:MAG: prepilin-type N-terminal cleavage/methylation domain-containing protein [Armatimonadota bacterium]
MTGRRGRGFTLIELLVVIAIIGILAAMVFPVFARARESARKTVCLSNVKNIGMAIQMYLADNNDTFPPYENRQEVTDYLNSVGAAYCPSQYKNTNPFLPWPLVLDEYVKNRDVWRCPSAKVLLGPGVIIPNIGPGGWFGYLQSHEGEWGRETLLQPCLVYYPPGWGGSVTDSIIQGRLAVAGFELNQSEGGSKAPEMTIGCSEELLTGAKMNSLPTGAANVVVAGDVWMYLTITTPAKTLFEVCRIWPDCAVGEEWFADCPWADDCGLTPAEAEQFQSDPSFRNKYTRHMGGSNFAFADGHAAWWNVYTLMDKKRPRRDQSKADADGCPIMLPVEQDSIYGFTGSECPIPYEWPFVP